jgi:hypothetical protein
MRKYIILHNELYDVACYSFSDVTHSFNNDTTAHLFNDVTTHSVGAVIAVVAVIAASR